MEGDAERVALHTRRRYSITVDFSIRPRCRARSWLQVLCDKMGKGLHPADTPIADAAP